MNNTDQASIDVTLSVDLGTFDELVERKWNLVDELDQLVDLKIDTEHRIASIRKEIAQCNEVLGKLKQHRGDSEDHRASEDVVILHGNHSGIPLSELQELFSDNSEALMSYTKQPTE